MKTKNVSTKEQFKVLKVNYAYTKAFMLTHKVYQERGDLQWNAQVFLSTQREMITACRALQLASVSQKTRQAYVNAQANFFKSIIDYQEDQDEKEVAIKALMQWCLTVAANVPNTKVTIELPFTLEEMKQVESVIDYKKQVIDYHLCYPLSLNRGLLWVAEGIVDLPLSLYNHLQEVKLKLTGKATKVHFSNWRFTTTHHHNISKIKVPDDVNYYLDYIEYRYSVVKRINEENNTNYTPLELQHIPGELFTENELELLYSMARKAVVKSDEQYLLKVIKEVTNKQ